MTQKKKTNPQRRSEQVSIDYERLVAEMASQNVFQRPTDLTVGMKLGIAVGGGCASGVYVAGAVPVLGSVMNFFIDCGRGYKMGYTVKSEQIRLAQAAKVQELEAQVPSAPPVPAGA
jgi:hypothetical protein